MSPEANETKPAGSRYRFGEFVLDVPDRQLWHGDARIDLNARYLDALILMVREPNRLVEKSRFFDEVWTDVVVSDSALSQCIKEIRKLLGDDASDPRYIQTVPGHGYRFVGEVEPITGDPTDVVSGAEGAARADSTNARIVRECLTELGAGTLGGGAAGLFGGMLYGFSLASVEAGVGTVSTLLVLVGLNVLVGLTGGFGVSLGLAGARGAAHYLPGARVSLRIAGAAAGGLFVGGLAKLLGVDAFNLLFGRVPAGITGGPEGAVLGAALASGAYLGTRIGNRSGRREGNRSGRRERWHIVAGGGIAGAAAGAFIPLAGGNLMGGSLDLLARSFDESRLQLDQIGPLFGEISFGGATEVVLGGIEGSLFGLCVIGAIVLAWKLTNDTRGYWRT